MRTTLFILTLIALAFATKVEAQSDQQTLYSLARQAAHDGENEKAISYYEDLFDKNNSDTYYRELIQLYPQVENYRAAEKLIKKQIRQQPDRLEYLADLGNIYAIQKEDKKAKNNFEKAVQKLGSNQQEARMLANKFNQYEQFQYAEEVYLKSRKLNKNENIFQFELARAYAQQGKSDEMIGEYLNIVRDNKAYVQSVKNIFQRILHPDPDGKQMEDLRYQLLKRIQKDPKATVYSELLIWLYIQDKNFNSAFIQAKAIDSRTNEKGKRLVSLGNLALSNKAYDAAEKCFNYIIDLGEDSPYFISAKMQLVKVLKEKILNNPDRSQKDLQRLSDAYEKSIADLGKNSRTLPLLRGQAELHAYFLNNIDTAISILENAINQSNLNGKERAATKIDLADLMLLDNQVWEASLLYSQVEKSFKYDHMGEIAKFKNAKIAFYTGDFYWAQAQLNVLKGSTSKLIANDAMELSLLITDNIGLDSIAEPLEIYARADLAYFKKDFEKAKKSLDSIPKYFPESSLKDEVLFKKFQIEKAKLNYENAAKNLRELIAKYGEDILGDNALFELAKLEEEEFKNKEKAMELYKQLITTYPASLFVVESRKRFRRLRGDNIDKKETPIENEEL